MMVEGFDSGMVSDYTGSQWVHYAIEATQIIGYLRGSEKGNPLRRRK